jgi:MFS family permease
VPKERLATGFGTFITLAGSVAIVSPLIGGFFIAQRKQTAIFLTSMIMTLVMTVARSRFLEEKSSMLRSRREQNSFKGSLGKIIQTKPLLALTFAYAFYNLFLSQSGSSFNYVVALYSADVLHLSQLYIGIMFSLLTLIVTQLALPFGKLADRFGKKNIIIASWATEMVFMMFFAYSFGPLFALVSFSLWVGFGAMDGPALDALLGDFTTEENRGISLGFFNTFASALNVPAIFLVGVLFSFNPIFPFYANLAIGLFAFGFFLYYFAFSKI